MLVNINTKPNSWRAFMLSARPKTLAGAAVPVIIGIAYALNTSGFDAFRDNWHGIVVAVLCMLFALVMQVDANFANDYFDFIMGRDNENSLDPQHACQQGLVTLKGMRFAIAITTALAICLGLGILYIVYLTQPNYIPTITILAVGALCLAFCFLYSLCMAQLALGDLCVVVFFGIIPVYFTAYVMMVTVPSAFYFLDPVAMAGVEEQTSIINNIDWRLFALGVSCGLIIDTLLVVNNYRDIEDDINNHKCTVATLLGKEKTEYFYLTIATLALVIVLICYGWIPLNIFLTFPVYFLYIGTWQKMRRIGQGGELNAVLHNTSRNMLIYGILTAILILVN